MEFISFANSGLLIETERLSKITGKTLSSLKTILGLSDESKRDEKGFPIIELRPMKIAKLLGASYFKNRQKIMSEITFQRRIR